MNTKKLDKWAELLLDTGKRNNLINFKDRKAMTVEVLSPSSDVLFEKIDGSASFEAVSYTHLDVYKRQDFRRGCDSACQRITERGRKGMKVAAKVDEIIYGAVAPFLYLKTENGLPRVRNPWYNWI